MQPQAEDWHAQATNLDADVRAGGQFMQIIFAALQFRLLVACIRANPENRAHVVNDDGLFRKVPGQPQQVGQLRVIKPGIKAQAEAGQLRKAFTKCRIGQAKRRHGP